MSKTQESTAIENLPAIQNWIAKNSGTPKYGIYEFPLYTDSHITGEFVRIDCPYVFLNTVPMYEAPGYVQAALIVRVDVHSAQMERPDFSKTNAALYHGGLLTDEIASLTSLCLGARMRAGGESRRFDDVSQDPLGRPIAWDRRPTPTLNVVGQRLILPDVVGTKSLDELSRLHWLLNLSPVQSVALIRASRLYQDALWIAEAEPALAWLMLVSALETAANQWRSENGSSLDRLEYAKPELVKVLTEAGGDALATAVAGHIEHSIGATKKFVDFSLQFLPAPPLTRPSEAFQIQWDKASMKKLFGLIYGYRSAALHGGTPFPAPMCDYPRRFGESEWYTERGTVGLAASTQGSVWLAKDVPINLHIFHHIVREILLSWWRSMSEDNSADLVQIPT